MLKNAVLLAISFFPRSVCMLAIHLLPFVLLFVRYDLFMTVSFLWVSLYFAAAAFMNTGILYRVFKPYYTPEA